MAGPIVKLLMVLSSIVFFPLLIFFSKSTFSKNYLRNSIRVLNSLDPDQIRRSVGADLDPNCLQKLSADDNRCRESDSYHLTLRAPSKKCI